MYTRAPPPFVPPGERRDGRNSKQTMASQAGLSLERSQQAEGFEMGAPMSDLVKRLRDRDAIMLSGLPYCGITMLQAADLIEHQAATIEAQAAEIERLRERLGPHGLEVVMINARGHYVSAAVKGHIDLLQEFLTDMENLKNTYRDDCHLAESHVEQAVKVMKLVADAVFVAGLTADNTQAWQAARAFIAEHGSDSKGE